MTLSGMDSDCIIESSSARLIHAAMAFLGGQTPIET